MNSRILLHPSSDSTCSMDSPHGTCHPVACSSHPPAFPQIFEACTESDVLLPSYVIFDGTSGPISTLRLATFTGTRFFRSLFTQLQSTTPRSTSQTAPSSQPASRRRPDRKNGNAPDASRACFRVSDWGNKMRLDAVSADTLDLLLRLIEGKAPARVTLRQACELFEALDYCLAQNLAAVVVYYLGPLIMSLHPKEVCTPPLCSASPLRSAPPMQ